ncbi:amino acid ABC transporter permease [Alkalilimnicola sp. S0819]|nr:amino acid ABC transporter permease [Alkalilimnicola sp. S0819]MPQ17555.1 ABC transporter permease subunit [Alkalilimnicola sp. S0819]
MVFQVVLLGAVALGIGWIVNNTLSNLARQGIASGLGFWGEDAGFGIIMSLIEYSEAASYGRAFLVGLLNTLLVSALGILLATLLGLVIGIARLSPNWLLRRLAAAYIETFRNIPLLLAIFFWYFAVLRSLPHPRHSIDLFGLAYLSNRGVYLPQPVLGGGPGWLIAGLILGVLAVLALHRWTRRRRNAGRPLPVYPLWLGIAFILPPAVLLAAGGLSWSLPALRGFNFQGGMGLIPEFVALLLALSIYTAAFVAEIVRAGIESVARGQQEAASALGLNRRQSLRLVVLPQAMRVIVPPLTNQYLNLTKNSSLAAAIAYPDLVSVFAGTVLNQTGQAVEVISITMAVYLTISLLIALAMNLYNRRTEWGVRR